ncbi:MAG: hypothetical protein V4592_16940 [Bacteroidota bacterium]
MKKVLLVLLVLPVVLFGCVATKTVTDNSAQLKEHTRPYKVFSIGIWQPGYSIITLTDANHEYFIIKTVSNESLKIGDTYQPQAPSTD